MVTCIYWDALQLADCVNVWLFTSWRVTLLSMCSPSSPLCSFRLLSLLLLLLNLGPVVGGCDHTTDVSAASSYSFPWSSSSSSSSSSMLQLLIFHLTDVITLLLKSFNCGLFPCNFFLGRTDEHSKTVYCSKIRDAMCALALYQLEFEHTLIRYFARYADISLENVKWWSAIYPLEVYFRNPLYVCFGTIMTFEPKPVVCAQQPSSFSLSLWLQ